MYYEVAKTELDDRSVDDYILSSITSPPPRPTCPGDWYLLRGEHWLLYDRERGLNVYWTSMNDEAIQSATSHEHLYRVGLINSQQWGLLEGIMSWTIVRDSPIPPVAPSRATNSPYSVTRFTQVVTRALIA
jgi:hypothetical protein